MSTSLDVEAMRLTEQGLMISDTAAADVALLLLLVLLMLLLVHVLLLMTQLLVLMLVLQIGRAHV